MTKKEAIIKSIFEMNTEMLSLLLDDNRSYMDVPKEIFIEKLKETFESLENQNINKFSKVLKGRCGGDCNNGCGGYSFLTSDNQSLDLIFEEENNDIKDLYTCTTFVNEEVIEDKNEIYIYIYDDEKTNYVPSERELALQNQIKTIYAEFNQFKNNVTDIYDFCDWNLTVNKLFDEIDPFERLNLKFIQPLSTLVGKNSWFHNLISLYPFATKAMEEFYKLKSSNEIELIKWVLKYEENELSYGNYEKVKDWEQNNLILHSLDKRIVLDCTGYEHSLKFSVTHSKYYWELHEKYQITHEQFVNEQAKNNKLKYNLETFIKVQGVYELNELNEPFYTECIFGAPEAKDQFIKIAGKELGINIKLEFLGSIANSFVNEENELQIKPSATQIKIDLENEEANNFYINKIGLDWKSILQNKVTELYNNYSIDAINYDDNLDDDIPF